MKICNNCGVELEPYMNKCPLCGEDVSAGGVTKREVNKTDDDEPTFLIKRMSKKQRVLVWDILSLIFLALTFVPVAINLIVNHYFSWSQYPAAICLTAFTYLTIFAFWKQRFALKLTGCFIVSAILLILLDSFITGVDWPVKIAIPILFMGNFIVAILYAGISHSKNTGLNVIGFIFLASGLLCVGVDAVLSFYKTKAIDLGWSTITLLCGSIIFILFLFLHYKLKWGRDLKKTFHL